MERKEGNSFWSTVPGIITAIAALITAIGGIYALVAKNNQNSGGKTDSGTVTYPNPSPSDSQNRNNGSSQYIEPPKDTPSRPTNEFRITEVMLRAEPFDYTGPCPQEIVFTGYISAVGGSGIVSYKFLRSDGAFASVQTISFEGPGTKQVQDKWSLSGTFSGWEQIQILTPSTSEMTSNKAEFKLTCQ